MFIVLKTALVVSSLVTASMLGMQPASDSQVVETVESEEVGTAIITKRAATAADFPVRPAVGHKATITTANSTTEVFQVSASCGLSYVTNPPQKVNNRMVATISASRSYGCGSGYERVRARMISQVGFSLRHAYDSRSVVYSGETMTWHAQSPICKYGNYRQWWTTSGIDGAGLGGSTSPEVSRPCEI